MPGDRLLYARAPGFYRAGKTVVISEPHTGCTAFFHRNIDRRIGLPAAAGEIGNVDGIGAVRRRPFAERADGTP